MTSACLREYVGLMLLACVPLVTKVSSLPRLLMTDTRCIRLELSVGFRKAPCNPLTRDQEVSSFFSSTSFGIQAIQGTKNNVRKPILVIVFFPG